MRDLTRSELSVLISTIESELADDGWKSTATPEVLKITDRYEDALASALEKLREELKVLEGV